MSQHRRIFGIDYPDLSDNQLVDWAQRQDEAAFAELVRRHRRACINVATAVLKNPDDAEDEVQNALLKAFLSLPRLQERAYFKTWLIRIVVNHCLMKRRKDRKACVFSFDPVIEDKNGSVVSHVALSLADPGRCAEELLAAQELVQITAISINRLPSTFKKVLTLQSIPGMTLEGLCERLKITPAAARARLHRARKELRTIVEPKIRTRYSSNVGNSASTENVACRPS
jgi:RNA polymerase sigma-70 factor (ECF subfamily)